MQTLTYKDLLRDPEYLVLRRRILERDNFRCSLCGDDKTGLTIYQEKPIPSILPWEQPDESFITLCGCCDAFTKVNKKITGFQIENIKAVFMRIPLSVMAVRLYRLDETVLLYLFNQDHKIVTSYDLSSAVKGLREFLK